MSVGRTPNFKPSLMTAHLSAEPADRIHLVDAIRGFALLGIFIANISVGFAFYNENAANVGTLFHPMDKTVHFWSAVFIEGKFYSIFSLLFGWGLAIQLKNAASNNRLIVGTVRRRLFFMLLLGMGHLFLLWTGDIVAFYALLGFLFLWIRNWSDRNLFITAIICLLLPILLYFLKSKFNVLAAPSFILYDTGTMIDEKWSGIKSFEEFTIKIRTANYFAQLKLLLSGFFYRYGDLFFQSRMFKVMGMFILGYLLGRNNRYQKILDNRSMLWTIVVLGLTIGLPSNYMLATYMKGDGYYQLKPDGIYRTIAYAFGVVPLALVYVALFFLSANTRFGQLIQRLFAPAGKMAFSNYILQSLIGCFIFYGIGLGLSTTVGPVIATGIALLVFTLQLVLSHFWLSYYRFGPIEWLWRSFTYRKWQQMKK